MSDLAAIAVIRRAIEQLPEGRISPEDGAKLAGVLNQFLAGRSLDEALQLPHAWRTLAVLQRRDEIIRQAAALVEQPRARNLAMAWHRFAADVWPRIRHNETNPFRAGSIDALLWQAMAMRPDVLGERRIRSIIAEI